MDAEREGMKLDGLRGGWRDKKKVEEDDSYGLVLSLMLNWSDDLRRFIVMNAK